MENLIELVFQNIYSQLFISLFLVKKELFALQMTGNIMNINLLHHFPQHHLLPTAQHLRLCRPALSE